MKGTTSSLDVQTEITENFNETKKTNTSVVERFIQNLKQK